MPEAVSQGSGSHQKPKRCNTLGRGKDMLFSPHSEIESGTKLKTEDRGLVKTRRHAEEVLPGLIAAGVAVGIQDDKKLQQCCNSARCRIYRDQKGNLSQVTENFLPK
ncbi:hypothetical protein R6Z07F_010039 [Ovis aries]